MAPELADAPFLLTVDDVFNLTGRGTGVIGRIESGAVRSGDEVEVWHDDRVVALAEAIVELITAANRPSNSVALLLRNLAGDRPVPGDTVRRSAG